MVAPASFLADLERVAREVKSGSDTAGGAPVSGLAAGAGSDTGGGLSALASRVGADLEAQIVLGGAPADTGGRGAENTGLGGAASALALAVEADLEAEIVLGGAVREAEARLRRKRYSPRKRAKLSRHLSGLRDSLAVQGAIGRPSPLDRLTHVGGEAWGDEARGGEARGGEAWEGEAPLGREAQAAMLERWAYRRRIAGRREQTGDRVLLAERLRRSIEALVHPYGIGAEGPLNSIGVVVPPAGIGAVGPLNDIEAVGLPTGIEAVVAVAGVEAVPFFAGIGAIDSPIGIPVASPPTGIEECPAAAHARHANGLSRALTTAALTTARRASLTPSLGTTLTPSLHVSHDTAPSASLTPSLRATAAPGACAAPPPSRAPPAVSAPRLPSPAVSSPRPPLRVVVVSDTHGFESSLGTDPSLAPWDPLAQLQGGVRIASDPSSNPASEPTSEWRPQATDTPVPLPWGDVLLHLGDFAIDGPAKPRIAALAKFDEWLALQPHACKIVLRGNHDPWDVSFPRANASYVTQPACVQVGGWRLALVPFNARPVRLTIPQGELLATHVPPKAFLDTTYSGERAGSSALRGAVERRRGPPPAVWVCGHIHEARGAEVVCFGKPGSGETVVINAANANSGRANRLVAGPVVLEMREVGGAKMWEGEEGGLDAAGGAEAEGWVGEGGGAEAAEGAEAGADGVRAAAGVGVAGSTLQPFASRRSRQRRRGKAVGTGGAVGSPSQGEAALPTQAGSSSPSNDGSASSTRKGMSSLFQIGDASPSHNGISSPCTYGSASSTQGGNAAPAEDGSFSFSEVGTSLLTPEPAIVAPQGLLLAVDLGLRSGLCLLSADGRLLRYENRVFTDDTELATEAPRILAQWEEDANAAAPAGERWTVTHLAIEGGDPPLWEAWRRAAEGAGTRVLSVTAGEWRTHLLLPKERRTGADAKAAARLVARQVKGGYDSLVLSLATMRTRSPPHPGRHAAARQVRAPALQSNGVCLPHDGPSALHQPRLSINLAHPASARQSLFRTPEVLFQTLRNPPLPLSPLPAGSTRL